MAVNGTQMLLLVNVGTAAVPIYEAVASQKDLGIEQASEEIDVSNKNSGRYAEFIPGRYSSTISLEALYVENEASYGVLQQSCEFGIPLKVRREYAGVAKKEADVFVTSLSEAFPDMGPSVVTAALRVSGPWRTL